jgi:hypothetical protein
VTLCRHKNKVYQVGFFVCVCVPAASLVQKRNNITQNKIVYSYQQKLHRTEGFNSSALFIFFFGLALPLVSLDLLCFLLFSRDVRRKGKSRINSDGTKGLPTKTLCTLAMSMFRVGLSLNHEAPLALDIWERWMEPTARVCSERP